jgi:hypothetical protein
VAVGAGFEFVERAKSLPSHLCHLAEILIPEPSQANEILAKFTSQM